MVLISPYADYERSHTVPPSAASQRVLVVDDSRSVRTLLRRFLERSGYMCHEAVNGAQAVEYLDRHEVTLMVTDCDMPVLDGLGLLRAVAQRAKRSGERKPPAVLVSGIMSGEIAVVARAAGAQAAMAKPLDLPAFRAVVDRLTADSRQARECHAVEC